MAWEARNGMHTELPLTQSTKFYDKTNVCGVCSTNVFLTLVRGVPVVRRVR